jgi:hypothetical protein
MARAFGYRVYGQLLKPSFVDAAIAAVAAAEASRNVTGVGGFMDISTLVSAAATVDQGGLGVGEIYNITLNRATRTVTNAALASNVATLTIGTHNVTVGARIVVADLPSPFVSLNGTYTVTAIAATTVSYALTGSNITSASVAAGTVTGGEDLKMDGTDKPFRILGLQSVGFSSDTSSDQDETMDDESGGYVRAEPASKNGSLDLAGKANLYDSAYKLMRLAEKRNVADGIMAKIVRVGPRGIDEYQFGVGFFSGIESPADAGTTVKWSSTFEFDSAPGLVFANAA